MKTALPRSAPTGKPFWWYPLWAFPLPEVLAAGGLWLVRRDHLAEHPVDPAATVPADHSSYLGIWLGCALIAVMLSATAAVFPANTYAPEIILLGYTVFAFAVGVYFRYWGTGVEIGLGLIALSGRATLLAGLSLLVRRLLLQLRLVRRGRRAGTARD
ncbi:hypothetical protein [Corynebacterium halotolerans]|uniref:Uncharacterized protein n=1 Tax=Corynebacterium halotolerans YIM 70093 = DSM 44683 TaxID=1121362 RepID=M1MUL5_9CORY|nr:hypothetical protein [Corynebacterium halotolerans]AGF71434.1 hypothetical protein A605_02100 [Corynebacterium halotolerans YIM 70093 = DSM 44683]